MNIEELKIRLFREEIPHYCYCIGGDEEQRICLMQSGSGWIVYYSEDGERIDLAEHSSEQAACEDLYRRVAQ